MSARVFALLMAEVQYGGVSGLSATISSLIINVPRNPGVNLNLQSNSKAADDNAQGLFRTTASNLAWSAELGIQFYFSRFKLTPGFRGTFMINDEMVADNPETPPYWTSAISSAKTRALMFVLKFE